MTIPLIEYVSMNLRRRYREQPPFDIGEDEPRRPRLGLSEREAQSKLRPVRNVIAMAGRNRAGAASTAPPRPIGE